ncbi:glutamate racemase [Ramlibacter sp. 2FC]|uniref:glutamate racemase n=1 Tax=Ramlibacter sp. 2FC TaxID=2502188 RepID=UPI0010F9144A|nr:glutamate racemase [Ramlibacter sp. 2FC]
MQAASAVDAPIGVFDSGIGGLSVLQALRAELPHERFVYLADSGHAPYGERGDAFVAARTHAISAYLRERYGIKALVVACNTATAAAIHEARAAHPDLPVVGVEPALKPAVAISRTGRIGVIGTRGTLASAKFARLLASLQGQAEFVVQPCDGLAHAIERSTAQALPADPASTEIRALCARYTGAMGRFGQAPGEIDTLVLGCTHYVFAQDDLRALLGPEIQLIATGEPVARQTRRLLQVAGRLAPSQGEAPTQDAVQLLTTGALDPLQAAAARWLQLPADCCAAVQVPS